MSKISPRLCIHCGTSTDIHNHGCPRHGLRDRERKLPVVPFAATTMEYWDHPAHPPVTPEIEEELRRNGFDDLDKMAATQDPGIKVHTFGDKAEPHLFPRDPNAPKPKVWDKTPEVASPPRNDNVVLPKHYTSYRVEPIYFMGENGVDIFQFNIIKYVMRHKMKNKLEDLRKASRYLEMYIKKEYLNDPKWAE